MEVPESRKDKIVHVKLKFWGISILAPDNFDSTESSKTDSSCVHLSLGFQDPLKMERTYEKLKQDGQATMPLKEQFWGDKFGMLTDKFGIKWMFNCQKKKVHSRIKIEVNISTWYKIHQKFFSVFPYLLANSEINLKHAG